VKLSSTLLNSDRVVARAKTHRHPMRVVTRRTGLSAELLRVWERRYRVVVPARTQTGRRLYSDSEIERLTLLYRATLGGRSIGLIASLSTPALLELLRQDADAEPARGVDLDARKSKEHASPDAAFVTDSLRAVERFDPAALNAVLRRASVALPATVFLEKVVASLLEQVDQRWREGTLQRIHGHLTTSAVRRVLERTTVSAPSPAPTLMLATLTGQAHELGALIAAAAAAAEGWSVTWLGANLPADDIAQATRKLRARVVGLSLVHPAGDVSVNGELRRLRSLLPRSVVLIAGGAASSGYAAVLDEIGARRITDLNALVLTLRDIAAKARTSRHKRALKQ
jgi:methanogenic corrinoid protein MtbC1